MAQIATLEDGTELLVEATTDGYELSEPDFPFSIDTGGHMGDTFNLKQFMDCANAIEDVFDDYDKIDIVKQGTGEIPTVMILMNDVAHLTSSETFEMIERGWYPVATANISEGRLWFTTEDVVDEQT